MEPKIKMTKQERKRAHGEGAGAQGESKREQKKSKQEEPVAKALCYIVRQSKNKDGTPRRSGTAFYRIRKDKLIKNKNRSKSNEFSSVGRVVNDPEGETQERGWETFDEAWREITRFQETFAPALYGQQAMYQIFMHFNHAGNTAPITFGDSTGFATKEEAEAVGDVRWSGVTACLIRGKSLFCWKEDRHGLTPEQKERCALGHYQAVLKPPELLDTEGRVVSDEVQGKAIVKFFNKRGLTYPTKDGEPDYEAILSLCRANAVELADQHYPMYFLRERKEKGESDDACLLRLIHEEMHMRPRVAADGPEL